MKALTAALVEAQLRKLELKLRHFEDLESLLDQQFRKASVWLRSFMWDFLMRLLPPLTD